MADTKVCLHVGLHKTGTTLLQAEVFPKLDNTHHIHTFELGTKLEEGKLNIISQEGFSGRTYHPNVDAKERYIRADRLKAMFPDADIIVGIRDQKTWLKSLYSQYLKVGGNKKFDWWKNHLDPLYLDTTTYIRYLNILFKKVYVYKFEDLKQDNQAFVKGICDFLGKDVPDYTNKLYQKSFTDIQMKGMRIINNIMRSRQNPHGKLPFQFFKYLLNMVRKSDNPHALREEEWK